MGQEAYNNWYQANRKSIIDDYFTFLKFQSISTDPKYKDDVRDCATWLHSYLEDIGLKTEMWETDGHPVIFGTKLDAGADRPTILIYHHYDVQPVDPLELWDSKPFEPTEKNGQVYARGAADNKGQCFYDITALKAFLELAETSNVNIKILIEGEEECGSESLPKVLEEKKEQLQADYLLVVDVDMPAPGIPGITLGVRGIVTLQVECTAAKSDLHSGNFGGMVMNPNRALADALAKCYDESGKVTIPGFYDDVKPLSEEERTSLYQEMDLTGVFHEFGITATIQEGEFIPIESNWIRPTLEINGMSGGYTGEGFKTIIPAKAMAKISCRLVPDQNPEKTGLLVADFLKKNIAPGIEVKIDIGGAGRGIRTPFQSQIVEVISKAYEDVYERKCEKILCGGSIPISANLEEASGADLVFLGVGLADDGIHAPNEHFGLDRFEKGFLVMTRILETIG